jgi:CYTH domain-containing protein
MIELEKTYLARWVPKNLTDCDRAEMLDVYIPASSPHPHLRLRKRGEILEMTKKTLVNLGDASSQLEQTIILAQDEFDALVQVGGKRVRKIRHYLKYNDRIIEVDVFQDALAGLVLVDVEFDTVEEKDSFLMPDFCLIEITQEDFLAGGMLCGKNYNDIETDLIRCGYSKL